jgi:hypothetical protein
MIVIFTFVAPNGNWFKGLENNVLKINRMTIGKSKTGLLFIVAFLFTLGLRAQSVFFNYTDGSANAYALQDVRKIDFSGELMNLHLLDGTVYTWNISSVGYYEYQTDTPLKIEDWLSKANDWQVKIYPNPSNGLQTLVLNLPKDEMLKLSIMDLSGKRVFEKDMGQLRKGEYALPLEFDGAAGQYALVLRNAHFSVSKKLIRK